MPKSLWDNRAAAHLLNRAGFGGTLDEMIEAGANAANVLAPIWAHPGNIGAIRMEARAAKRNGDASKLREVRKMEGDELLDLRRWWLDRIATTSAPLLEKMTPFWHGHF